MSRLQLRRLRLRAQTDAGLYGADLAFAPGLNVLEARNSRGKSICTQSILYGLGMEAMLGPRHDVPLPDAMTRRLRTRHGTWAQVLESRVSVEIEGVDGRVATIVRWAKHPTIDRKLVSVWDGPVLSDNGSYQQHDHLVRDEGVVSRDVGLHHFIADFIGWNIPEILRTDGRLTPLYPEYMFALLFVEQRGGWSGLQALEPSFYVPEAKRRAVEFILDLGIYERGKRRAELTRKKRDLHSSWRSTLAQTTTALRGTGLVLTGVPSDLALSWPPEPEPALITVNGQRPVQVEIGRVAEALEASIGELEAIPPDADEKLVAELQDAESMLPVLAAATAGLEAQVARELETQQALDRTMRSLERDRERNRDAKRIQDLGSDAWTKPEHECPTCHRPLDDVVLPAGAAAPMTIADNIAFIDEELGTFGLLRKESERISTIKQESLNDHQQQLAELRKRTRALRTAITAGREAPSVAAIQRRLELEARLERLKELETIFGSFLDELASLSAIGRDIETELAKLPSEQLNSSEREKLQLLRSSVVNQLAAYGFESIPPHELNISERSYHPARDGAEVSLGISASDGIRMVWAYLLGLQEVARAKSTNHPGFLLFDEPRQQSTERPSLNAFLARAAVAGEHDQQVILATSEEPELLAEGLDGVDHRYQQLSGLVLQALD
jgi:hypothetical protein